ncbi:DnaJ domain-containing protein [Plectonema cf. radiosum LEGE 06105]|uniref:DnaJ domain-containing protein n=1 Tax=Plectonema cf. radiosum LEGE 06105 TaxID=945769 RepID=A0A8J7FCM4_9CYAN|nr:DnaJ domain-containing protein [Plectonema radiosum]MBE9213758.1 DnaJ domain-containing protein [Plectonema cf. radiosum LEGE 06105]
MMRLKVRKRWDYATYDEVKAAYKKLATIWHPDCNKSSDATQIMHKVTPRWMNTSVDGRTGKGKNNVPSLLF